MVNLFVLENHILLMLIELHLVGMETYKLDKLVVQLQLVLLVNMVGIHLNHLLILQLVFVMLQDQQQIAVP